MTKYSAESKLANLFGLYNRLNEDTTYFIRELIDDEVIFDKPIIDGDTKIIGINTNDVLWEVKGSHGTYPIEELDFLVAIKIIEVIIKKLHN